MPHPLVALLEQSKSCAGSSALDATPRIGVLDLRKTAELSPCQLASTNFIKGALCIPTGAAGLDDRFSWLPPPSRKPNKAKSSETRPGSDPRSSLSCSTTSCKLVVLCEEAECDEIRQLLDRWDVVGVISSSPGQDEAGNEKDQFWSQAESCGLTCAGGPSRADLLFEPSPVIKTLTSLWDEQLRSSSSAPDTATVLDLGCGAGRDIAWLTRYGRESTSKEGSRVAWRATGIDYLPATIRRVGLLASDLNLTKESRSASYIEALLAAEVNTSEGISVVHTDRPRRKGASILSAEGHSLQATSSSARESLRVFASANLPHETYDVVLLVRFLPLPAIYNLCALAHTNSMIAISHFTTIEEEDVTLVGEQELKVIFQPDHEKRFLRRHIPHMTSAWSEATGSPWTVVHHSISGSEDGRPLRSVIFQRS